MLEILEQFVVGFGVCAAFSSMILGLYFIRSHTGVGRSVAYVFFAESLGLWMTVAFAIMIGVLDLDINEWIQLSMRTIMFITAAGSSVHMAFAIDGLLRKG